MPADLQTTRDTDHTRGVRWEKRLGEYMMDKLERLGDLACEKRLDNER